MAKQAVKDDRIAVAKRLVVEEVGQFVRSFFPERLIPVVVAGKHFNEAELFLFAQIDAGKFSRNLEDHLPMFPDFLQGRNGGIEVTRECTAQE